MGVSDTYDIITLQKMIERDYTIPEPQTAEEVIGYYARRIAQDVLRASVLL
jgi:type III restriction enzyme